MDPLKSEVLPRNVIAEFVKTPRGIRQVEALQSDTINVYQAVSEGSFLTLGGDPNLGAERILTPVAGELDGSDGGAGANYTLGLADTAVVAAHYGAATKTVSVTIDAKGRITAAAEFTLNTDNVTEGSNLFFTNARARSALSGGSGINYNAGTGVIATAGFSGTVTPVTSITVVNGIVTAVS